VRIGDIQPSSEAEFRPRGRPALERGGVLPEGCWGRLLAGPLVLLGPWLYEVWFVVGEFVCVFIILRKWVFPGY
jgi:hypothetical protein